MSTIKKYFDTKAKDYLNKSSKGLWSIIREKEKNTIIKTLGQLKDLDCLELGSGSGYYTKLLASLSPKRIVAVDLSHAMLNEIKIPGIYKIQADIQNINFRISFNRILCAGVIEFLSYPEIFFNNIKDLLSQNGRLIILIPAKGLLGNLYKLFHSSHNIDIKLFNQIMIKNILNQCKLKIVSIEKPTPMTYVLKISNEY